MLLGIEPWKIRREWDRAKLKFAGLLSYPLEPLLERKHFAWRDRELVAEEGQIDATDHVAIFLIFQPVGLQASTFKTLEHLIDQGYAPLVVSNAPLSTTDKARLLELAWSVFERPNYGYDFGGYRDGVWYLEKQGIFPDKLLFLNDSVWFPALQTSTLIADFEAMDADYVSTQVAERSDKGSVKLKQSRTFYTSYFFLVKRPALESKAFKDFWLGYRASSNKLRTIQRGERGFAYAMFDGGIRAESLLSRETFESVVRGLTETELLLALNYLVCVPSNLEDARVRLLAAKTDHDWRQKAIALLCNTRLRNYFGACPYVTLNIMKFPIVKKNADSLYQRERQMIIKAIDNRDINGVDDVSRNEIEKRT